MQTPVPSSHRWRNRAALASRTGTVAIAFLVACGPRDDRATTPRNEPAVTSPAHIVLITFSDLRIDVDHPFLAEAQPAYAPSSLAQQSAASIFTGRLPSRAGAIGLDEAQPPPTAPTLPVWLRQAGYSTAWFSQADWGARDGFTRGMDWVETAPENGWTAADVVQRFDLAARDLLGPGKPPAFIAAHLDAPLRPSAEELEASRSTDAWRNRYMVRAASLLDAAVGMVERTREAAASAQRPVVLIFVGLSGFDLAEHDEGIGSGWTMHEASIRVPLIAQRIGSNGTAALFADSAPRLPPSLVDLTPTLLTFAGVGAPLLDDDLFDGSSWASIVEGRALWNAAPSDAPRIAELVVRERNITRAVMASRGDDVLKFLRVARAVPVKDRPTLMRGYEEIQAAMLSGATPTPELFGPAAQEDTYVLLPSEGPLPLRVHDIANGGTYRRLSAALRRYAEHTASTGYQPLELTRRLEIDPDQMRDLESLGYL